MGKRQSVPLLMALPRAQDARVVVKAAKHATLAIVAVNPKRNAHANPAINAVNPKRHALVRRSLPAPSVSRQMIHGSDRYLSLLSIPHPLHRPIPSRRREPSIGIRIVPQILQHRGFIGAHVRSFSAPMSLFHNRL